MSRKRELIDLLISGRAISIAKDESHYTLKSGRESPYFVNIGEINSGEHLSKLAELLLEELNNTTIGSSIVSNNSKVVFYGIPEKGISIAISLAMKSGLSFFYTRRTPKEYGEATGKRDNKIREIVGKIPEENDTIIIVDDVITSGKTKLEAIEDLRSMGYNNLPLLLVCIDREEVDINGEDAKLEIENKTGCKVHAIANTSDICEHLINCGYKDEAKRIAQYLMAYGTKEAKKNANKILEKLNLDGQKRIINKNRSIVPACDFEELESLKSFVEEIDGLDIIGGYKIGAPLAIRYGLDKIVDTMKNYTEKPIIYDHQKAGCDIPETSKKIVKACKRAGADALIVFPLSGRETQRAFIYHALENDLPLIIGGKMTHQGFSSSDGGYIDEKELFKVYQEAFESGIRDFVVPGNQPEFVDRLTRELIGEKINISYYATGIGAQGGSIRSLNNVLRNKYANLTCELNLHIIAGRRIYESENKINAIRELEEELLSY